MGEVTEQSVTPAEARLSDGVELAGMLTRSGTCQVEVARVTGVSRTLVQRWYDRMEKRLPHVHDLRRMPSGLARRLLDWCAEPHGLTVVERVKPDSALDHLGQLHRLLQRGADVSVDYSGALADGVITPSERERLRSKLRESIAAHRSVLEQLDREAESHRCGTVVNIGGAA